MKRVLLLLLAVLLLLGSLGAAGLVGYRIGLHQGIQVSANGDGPFVMPHGFGFSMGPQRMPLHHFEFHRGMGPGAFGRVDRGFGFFPGVGFLLRLLFWGLVIWAVYLLATRSGWRLTRTTPISETPPPPPSNMENRE
jgi:hypothetical protein